jgi:hypothetical protein
MKYESPIKLTIQKIWPMLKFFCRQTDRQTDGQVKNYMPPIFRYGGIKNQTSDEKMTDIQ